MRLYTFGCSYTQYHWPSWADIIARDLGCYYENWGKLGIGNVAIQHKLLECDLKNRFTEDDLVLVAWSGWSREDRYLGKWIPRGNALSNPFFGNGWLQKHWHIENDIVKNMTAIISANRCHCIDFQSHILDYNVYLNEKGQDKQNYDMSKAFTQKKFKYLRKAMPKYHLFSRENNSQFENLTEDTHPDLLCQLEHANYVYKHIGRTMKQSTIDYYQSMNKWLIDRLKKSPPNLIELEQKMTALVKEWNYENG